LRTLLISSLVQFEPRRARNSPGLFPAVQSLDELFETGCGAVVRELLSRLPLDDASGKGYVALLQTATALGQLRLVELLIARNIDVNTIRSHYGTSL
jgi:hypothetical protein